MARWRSGKMVRWRDGEMWEGLACGWAVSEEIRSRLQPGALGCFDVGAREPARGHSAGLDWYEQGVFPACRSRRAWLCASRLYLRFISPSPPWSVCLDGCGIRRSLTVRAFGQQTYGRRADRPEGRGGAEWAALGASRSPELASGALRSWRAVHRTSRAQSLRAELPAGGESRRAGLSWEAPPASLSFHVCKMGGNRLSGPRWSWRCCVI